MTPTLEERTHELADSTKCTKVDGSLSYHYIFLNYKSSLLITFNTERERESFHFISLPFRLACAQDIFCRMRLVLNKSQCEVKKEPVKFFGCIYDKYGAYPDPSEVSVIKEMSTPLTKGELQSFLGMVTYLAPVIIQVDVSGKGLGAALFRMMVQSPSHLKH